MKTKQFISRSLWGGGFILALLVISCQPDLFEDNPTAQDQTKITITHTSLKRLSKSAPAIYDKSLSLALGSSRLTKSADDSVSLAIDTTSILITEGLDYKNYIFRVRPEADSPPNELKNLMLVKLKDSLTHQYLVTYQMLDSVTIDTTNVRIEGFFADDLRNYTPMKCGGTDTQMTWVEGHYVEVRCKLPGRHGIGAVDCKATGDEAAYVYWVAGQYDVKFIKQEPCADLAGSNGNVGVINGGNTAPGGNNNDGDDGDVDDNTDQSDDSIKVGIVPNRELVDTVDPECDYLKGLLDDTTFKQRLDDLLLSAENDNFERIDEYTEEWNGNKLPIYSSEGPTDGTSAPVRDLPNTILRVILVHTHYESSIGYSSKSMFSYADMNIFLKDVEKVHTVGKNTGKMTSILVASNGTSTYVYAIKKNPDSSIANLYVQHQTDVLGMTDEERMKEREDYYKSIHAADSQEKMEIAALQQLEKMGLHLYRADDNQSEWKRLTLNPNPSNPNKPEMGTPESCD